MFQSSALLLKNMYHLFQISPSLDVDGKKGKGGGGEHMGMLKWTRGFTVMAEKV